MASLEKRGNQFRIVFWIRGKRFSRSLKTANQREAQASLVRLDDNLRRFELGLLSLPDDADPVAYLLSDGKASEKPSLPGIRTLKELFDNYFAAIPENALEASTRQGMRIHAKHLKAHFGTTFSLAELVQRMLHAPRRGGLTAEKGGS